MTKDEAIKLALDALKLVRAYEKPFDDPYEDVCEAIDAIEELDEPVQEPVAWVDRTFPGLLGWYVSLVPPDGTKLYLTPPRREWASLTDEEIKSVWTAQQNYDVWCIEFARAIEAKLKGKNA